MTTNPNEPVHPCDEYARYSTTGEDYFADRHMGMTKRELFAAMAMQGMLAKTDMTGSSPNCFAAEALDHADALIAALNAEAKP